MTVRPILRYPDPRLRLGATEVERFDAALRDLAADLLDTMRAAPGIGITAPHIGVPQRLVLLELPGADGVRIYVNPKIVDVSAERVRHPEGSVSMPGATEEIERHARVTVRFQDLDGAVRTEAAEGLRAICHQHEIDQLDGLFWLQRLSRLRRDRLVKRWEKSGHART